MVWISPAVVLNRGPEDLRRLTCFSSLIFNPTHSAVSKDSWNPASVFDKSPGLKTTGLKRTYIYRHLCIYQTLWSKACIVLSYTFVSKYVQYPRMELTTFLPLSYRKNSIFVFAGVLPRTLISNAQKKIQSLWSWWSHPETLTWILIHKQHTNILTNEWTAF